MTRHIHWKVALAAVIGIGATAAIATATPGARHSRRSHGFSVERLARKLGLSADQTSRIQAIEDQKAKDTIALRTRIEQARNEARKMALGDNPDRTQIFAKIDEVARLHAEMRKIEVGARLDQRALLSPEQREQFRDLVTERMERFGHRGHGDGAHSGRFRGGDMEARPDGNHTPSPDDGL